MQQASLRRQDSDSVHLLAEGGPSQQLKFPFVACEVFCCEVDALIEAVLESDRHLQHLCSLLDAEPPLNCVLAGYFARIFTALLMKRPQVCLALAWCRFGKSVSTSVLEQSMRNQPGVLTRDSGLFGRLGHLCKQSHLQEPAHGSIPCSCGAAKCRNERSEVPGIRSSAGV